jgi:YtcA family
VRVGGKILTRFAVLVAMSCAPCLFGCDPVVGIAGAEFPDWLVCVVAGSTLAAACHPLLLRGGLERLLRPLPFFYGSLIVMFSLLTWIIFFNRV